VHPTGLEPFSVLPKTSSIIANSAGSVLNTNANFTASLIILESGITTFGSTSQDFGFGSLSRSGVLGGNDNTELYRRYVNAVNGSIVGNREVVAGSVVSDFSNDTALQGSATIPASMDMSSAVARFRQGGLRMYELLQALL